MLAAAAALPRHLFLAVTAPCFLDQHTGLRTLRLDSSQADPSLVIEKVKSLNPFLSIQIEDIVDAIAMTYTLKEKPQSPFVEETMKLHFELSRLYKNQFISEEPGFRDDFLRKLNFNLLKFGTPQMRQMLLNKLSTEVELLKDLSTIALEERTHSNLKYVIRQLIATLANWAFRPMLALARDDFHVIHFRLIRFLRSMKTQKDPALIASLRFLLDEFQNDRTVLLKAVLEHVEDRSL